MLRLICINHNPIVHNIEFIEIYNNITSYDLFIHDISYHIYYLEGKYIILTIYPEIAPTSC